jgi:glycosyltransferase involved in cell wall biosynthesis
MEYVLITTALNEEAYIGRTIRSVISQTVLPMKWVIVSDGSEDRTDEIIRDAAREVDFIQFVRHEAKESRLGFSSKVFALRAAALKLSGLEYEYIGILDADISLDAHYYENMISKMESNVLLGIAGGFIYEKRKDGFECRAFNTDRSVAGGIQFFRRKCYEQIGGLTPVEFGGEDWIAETTARMHGWRVEAFPDFRVYHHKSSGGARGVWRERVREGKMDHAVGSHPLFEVIKCLRRTSKQRFSLGGFVRMASFLKSYCLRETKSVPPCVEATLRREQMQRLRSELIGRLRFFYNRSSHRD